MFDWREFLELAHALGGAPGSTTAIALSEATSRSCVSRAYYAAFCHARNYAQRHLGYVVRHAPSDHGLLRRHYAQLGMIDVADALDNLREWRNQCDYDDVVAHLPGKVSSALGEAASVVQQL